MIKKIFTEDFVISAIKKHGYLYDYSKTNYINSKTKIIITCKIHGDFEQLPSNHKKGYGCNQCGLIRGSSKQITPKEDFFKACKDIHYDKYKYNENEYVNSNSILSIMCEIHGEFKQKASSHKLGYGCNQCGVIRGSAKQQKSHADNIIDFKKTHGNRYIYNDFYEGKNSKNVSIICRNHGEFSQILRNHKSGAGCPTCGKIKQSRAQTLTKADVVRAFIKVHGDKYNYDSVVYKGDNKKVNIKCKIHGIFQQIVSDHKQGKGCLECAGRNLDTEKVIAQFKNKQKIIYDYAKVKYIDDTTKVEIICKEHGSFFQSPTNHKQGNGCPKCSSFGFDSSKSGILYYIRVNKDGQEAYKIGVTNNSLVKRFRSDMQYITPIKIIEYEYGIEALAAETLILKEFIFAKWTGKDLLKNGGNSELFKYDILNLDIDNNLYY